MRTWMVPPQIMCRQHLLGEHNEIHKFVGAVTKRCTRKCKRCKLPVNAHRDNQGMEFYQCPGCKLSLLTRHTYVGPPSNILRGYRSLVAADMLPWRHDQLVLEFARRGWPSGRQHKTPFPDDYVPPWEGKVDFVDSFMDLMFRCSRCKYRWLNLKTPPEQCESAAEALWWETLLSIRNRILA